MTILLVFFIYILWLSFVRNSEKPACVRSFSASGGVNLPAEVLERMLGLLTIVKGILAEGTREGEFRSTEPVMTHLTLIGAILMLSVVSPIRKRVADLGSTIDLPGADADIAKFLGDLLLNGIAAPRSGEPT